MLAAGGAVLFFERPLHCHHTGRVRGLNVDAGRVVFAESLPAAAAGWKLLHRWRVYVDDAGRVRRFVDPKADRARPIRVPRPAVRAEFAPQRRRLRVAARGHRAARARQIIAHLRVMTAPAFC